MRKTGEMLAAAMVIMLLAVGCQRGDERKENIGVSTPTEAVTAEETPTPVTTEAAVPTAIPTEAVTPTVIPTEALTGALTPTGATTEALAPTPTGIEEVPAEDDPDKRTGVFNWKTRSQKYGYDNYELYTSDGSTKVEKKNSNIYVNEKPVYTAAYSDEAHFWIIDLDKSDDEEEILVIDYQDFYSWEERLIKTVFSSKKAGDFCRLTVSVFEKDGTLIFNNTSFYIGDPGYVALWGDGKIYLDKAYVDLPPEGYYADHITFVTVFEEQDNGKKKRTIVPEESELFFQSKIGCCPKIYTARPFYAYSVNDNSLTEISPQIITLSSAGSEKLYFSAEDKNAYWVDIHRSNNGWIIGESYDTSVWLQLGENCPSALYPVRLPIIKCEKEALPLTEFVYAYSGVAKDESELLADNRKDLWNSLINGEAELIFSTLPDTEEELQNIDKSGLEFSVRPVIALSGCGIPLNGTHWELDTQWKFDSHDYYNKRATDDSSIIYAVIREDAETFSHARELFKWFGLGKVVKHVNGIAYFSDDPETYQAIRDYTVKDPSPYEYDKSIIESGYDDDYILDATAYTEGAVDEEDILEFGTDYYNDYWEDYVSFEHWYAYITCAACRLMSKNSERYQELKAAVEEINLKLAGRVEEVIRMGQDTIESM
ncbi:MAG: hypothetical protein J6S72_03545, partial [Lachnospiraceae bacterium]|nr:hypothetical protein [Lachnospiraceae bacterium]